MKEIYTDPQHCSEQNGVLVVGREDKVHQLQPFLLLPKEQRGAREESACTALRFQSQV